MGERFGVDDLVRTRLAISPMWETAAAIRALRNPGLISLHLPWIKRIRSKLEGLDHSLAFALLPRRGYIADFLCPNVVWADGGLKVKMECAQEIELNGRGLLLVPSAFSCHRTPAITEPPWQPTLI